VENAYQMRVFELLHNRNVIQLDVKILVDAFEGAPQLDVVLEFHGDFVVDECFEEAAWVSVSATAVRLRTLHGWEPKIIGSIAAYEHDVQAYLKNNIARTGERRKPLRLRESGITRGVDADQRRVQVFVVIEWSPAVSIVVSAVHEDDILSTCLGE
jgi:hypothetical protein